MFSATHLSQGSSADISALISSSSIIRPAMVSTRNIFPGCRRPLRTILDGSMSATPISDASTTKPSSVMM